MTTPAPPPFRRRFGEVRGLREPVRLVLRTGGLRRVRTAHPKPVMAVPGLATSDFSSAPLRRFLRSVGHQPIRWELGTNGRHLARTLGEFGSRLQEAADRAGRPVALVGWSLGGVVAREAARDHPDLVSQVITYGAPLEGPRFTAAASLYAEEDIEEIERYIVERRARPISVPVTALYSRIDGVVDWRTCIDRLTPGAENIEVKSTHFGMALDPDVWLATAAALERPDS